VLGLLTLRHLMSKLTALLDFLFLAVTLALDRVVDDEALQGGCTVLVSDRGTVAVT
jgi:preprotein translocase subunit SecG